MFQMRRGRRGWVLATLVVIGLSSGLQAAPGPDVRVKLSGSVQQRPRTGAAWVSLKDGSQVAPGDRILYKLDLTNHGVEAARNPMALGPIPAGTAFVPGTASTGASMKLDYSIDGGKTFSDAPSIKVTGKDGRTEIVPAPADRYTTIRWTLETPLLTGATTTVSYQVQVR
jgi:uncharacterized repeat protein (TIGR01451 family)